MAAAPVRVWVWLRWQLNCPRWFLSRPRLHPVLCSWCLTYRPGQEPRVCGWTTVERSSGICPECKLRALAEAGLDDDTGTRRQGDTGRQRPAVAMSPCHRVSVSPGAQP